MIYFHPKKQSELKSKLKELRFIDFDLTNKGSELLKFSMITEKLSLVIPTYKEKQILKILGSLNSQIANDILLK